MSTPAPATETSAPPAPAVPTSSLRAEDEALYTALAAGILGAILGFVVAFTLGALPLWGDGVSFGGLAGLAAGVVAAAASAVAYWRARSDPGNEWRLSLPAWIFSVNAISVALVHAVLAVIATFAFFAVLSEAFIGLLVPNFWAVVFGTVTLGLVGYSVYLSSSHATTQRMSTLLMAFIVLGTLTAMVTTTDPLWWTVHFSQLGSFEGTISTFVFNGTLIAGGLLVTTFAVYVANDLRALTGSGALTETRAPHVVSTMFVIMGIMLAGVGIFPVDVNLLLHNLSASGMAVMFLGLLVGGPWILRGMPRSYFIASWLFLAALLASTVLFVVGYFGLTAFEIIVFALIFGWIAVFIRFLGVTGRRL